MNRSKKIEDLIGLVALLMDSNAAWPVISLTTTKNELWEELAAHLSDYFWSCETDSWEYAFIDRGDGKFDYMGLDEMVKYYNEHSYGELRD
tara:strand:- start:8800 stop:9072 length:273 start_codon:yes stop_codon:yes gene_type:complete